MEFLNQINDFLTGHLGEFGPLIAVGVLGLFMVLLAVPLLMSQPEDPLKKLKREMNPNTLAKPKKEQLRQSGRNEQLQRFANFLEPQDADELSAMQLKLRQAGYQSKDAVRFFHFAQMALGLVGLVLGVLYVFVIEADKDLDGQAMLIRVLGPGGRGLLPAPLLDHPQGRYPQGKHHPCLSRRAGHAAGLRRGGPVAGPVHRARFQGIARLLPRSGR